MSSDEMGNAGHAGAEDGLSPWAPEAYDADAEGPTTSTQDPVAPAAPGSRGLCALTRAGLAPD